MMALIFRRRSTRSWVKIASRIWAENLPRMSAAMAAVSGLGDRTILSGLISTFCAWQMAAITSLARRNPSRNTWSENSLPPASSMTTSLSVPATSRIMSSSLRMSRPGLTKNCPAFQPILTAPRGVVKGMVEESRAAEAPMMPMAS